LLCLIFRDFGCQKLPLLKNTLIFGSILPLKMEPSIVHRQVLPSIVQTEEMKAMLKVFSVLLLFSVCNRGMINFFSYLHSMEKGSFFTQLFSEIGIHFIMSLRTHFPLREQVTRSTSVCQTWPRP
jgi:hypothetical protein